VTGTTTSKNSPNENANESELWHDPYKARLAGDATFGAMVVCVELTICAIRQDEEKKNGDFYGETQLMFRSLRLLDEQVSSL